MSPSRNFYYLALILFTFGLAVLLSPAPAKPVITPTVERISINDLSNPK